MTTNALIIWRDPAGRLRLAETDVSWQSLAARAGSTLLVPLGFDEMLNVTAEEAAERVLCLAEPGRPRVGGRVSWWHDKGWQYGAVTGIDDTTREAVIQITAAGTSAKVRFGRLTVEEG